MPFLDASDEVFRPAAAARQAPPRGTQDLLFAAARKLRRCEAALSALFEQRGFGEVIPPAIESAEVFELGSAQGAAGALRTLDRSGHLLALRADFTSQVARIAATRLAGVSPLRLYYRGSVVREGPADSGVPREQLQAGCELVGAPEPEADAEILALAEASLRALGLPPDKTRISVGAMGYFSALTEALGATPRLVVALRDALDRKDLSSLQALCEREIPPGPARSSLLLLARPPRPAPEADALLAEARALSPAPAVTASLDRLAATLHQARARSLGGALEVDLGEVRGLGYYTGLVFNLYAEGAPRAVGGGGRYDHLLGRFGDPRPAVGFSLDLDGLMPLALPEAGC